MGESCYMLYHVMEGPLWSHRQYHFNTYSTLAFWVTLIFKIVWLSNTDAFTMPVNEPTPAHTKPTHLFGTAFGNAVKLSHMLNRRKMMTHSTKAITPPSFTVIPRLKGSCFASVMRFCWQPFARTRELANSFI